MQYLFFKPLTRRSLGLCLTALSLCGGAWLPAQAAVNEVDEEGRLIAAPDETDLVERGYLFYPQRVLPKKNKDKRRQPVAVTDDQPAVHAVQAPVVEQLAAAQPVQGEHGAAPAPGSTGQSEDTHQSQAITSQTLPPVLVKTMEPHGASSDKPVAGSVIVQPMERVKAVTLPDHGVGSHASEKHAHDDKANAHEEPTAPALSKAEQAKLERAKAAQARAEKLKEEQAKAEMARAERLKEAQAKAELAKLERAKAAQARTEKMKEEQAKAELARAERAKAAAQAKALKAQEELAKAEKLLEELSKADKAKAEAPKEEQAKEASSKDEHAKTDTAHLPSADAVQPAKDEHAAPAAAKPQADQMAEPAKDEQGKDEHAKPDTAHQAEPAKHAHGEDDHHKDEHPKSEPIKTTTAAPAHAAPSAGQKLLLTNQESRLLSTAD